MAPIPFDTIKCYLCYGPDVVMPYTVLYTHLSKTTCYYSTYTERGREENFVDPLGAPYWRAINGIQFSELPLPVQAKVQARAAKLWEKVSE